MIEKWWEEWYDLGDNIEKGLCTSWLQLLSHCSGGFGKLVGNFIPCPSSTIHNRSTLSGLGVGKLVGYQWFGQ